MQHIAIYLGAGKMVEARQSGTKLMVSDVRLGSTYFGAVRVNTGEPTGHIHQTWGTGVWTKAEPSLAARRVYAFPYSTTIRVYCQKHAELVDSAVNAIVQAYLDSIAADPSARKAGLPSWTADVAGKKFGLDSSNIYIAGLKIPAAVLALLPIPAGNIDQNRAYNHLMAMRADLQENLVSDVVVGAKEQPGEDLRKRA